MHLKSISPANTAGCTLFCLPCNRQHDVHGMMLQRTERFRRGLHRVKSTVRMPRGMAA